MSLRQVTLWHVQLQWHDDTWHIEVWYSVLWCTAIHCYILLHDFKSERLSLLQEASCQQLTAYTVSYLWHSTLNIQCVEIASSCRPHFSTSSSWLWRNNLNQYICSEEIRIFTVGLSLKMTTKVVSCPGVMLTGCLFLFRCSWRTRRRRRSPWRSWRSVTSSTRDSRNTSERRNTSWPRRTLTSSSGQSMTIIIKINT